MDDAERRAVREVGRLRDRRRKLQHDLDRARAHEAEAVRALNAAGWSWAEIGRRFYGISAQAAHQRFT